LATNNFAEAAPMPLLAPVRKITLEERGDVLMAAKVPSHPVHKEEREGGKSG
jgi:hypothetical protein